MPFVLFLRLPTLDFDDFLFGVAIFYPFLPLLYDINTILQLPIFFLLQNLMD